MPLRFFKRIYHNGTKQYETKYYIKSIDFDIYMTAKAYRYGLIQI